MRKLFTYGLLFAGLIIGVAVLIPGQRHSGGAALHAQSIVTLTASSRSSSDSVMGKPTITASSIDRILCTANSPACGTGQALYTDGVASGIDPIFALAFFQHESSFGRDGVARATLGLGNIRCSQGYRCIGGFRAYASWQQGYEDWYQLIRYYVTQWHKSTLDQIIPTYAPSSENDTRGYIDAIKSAVQEWRK